MKKSLLAVTALATFMSFSVASAQNASTGVIEFTGTISDSSCEISNDGGKVLINFDGLSSKNLQVADSRSTVRSGSFKLDQCALGTGEDAITQVLISVEPSANKINGNDTLWPIVGAANSAKNVGIALKIGGTEVGPDGIDKTAADAEKIAINLTNAGANVSVEAQLVSLGAATAGTIDASVTVNMEYK